MLWKKPTVLEMFDGENKKGNLRGIDALSPMLMLATKKKS